MFEGPIPLQSLTTPPGGSPWEQPPRHVRVDEAAEEIFERITNPESAAQLFALLDSGMSIEAVTRIILFSGFVKGHWNVDLMILLMKPVYYMIAGLAERAGIKARGPEKDRTALDDIMDDLTDLKASEPQEDAPVPTPAPSKLAPTGGLMGLPTEE
jgi:hypothetical protein